MKKQVLIVTGPTGVGKTDLVLKIADTMPAEVINADIGQMYTPLSIGTAKPDWKNETVPHHLFDILDEPEDFTVIRFRKRVTKLIEDIWQKGKTPIIVGGSTLYIKSLFFPPLSKEISCKNKNTNLEVEGCLWEALNKVDSKRASQIHPNDNYRLERALNIWHQTGDLPSNYVPKFDPITKNMTLIIVNSAKEKLYKRIDNRVGVMMDMGWLDEVKSLPEAWHGFLHRKKIIGYEVVLDYLSGLINYEECISIIQKRVRNYAKRQQTFWRGFQKQISQHKKEGMQTNIFEVDLTASDVDLYIKQLLNVLRGNLN